MPEICRTPLEDTLLLMKDMGIKNVETFPFPTQPERNSIDAALHILTALGAVDKQKEITTLGRAMMHYPVGVRYAKMLVLALEKKEILGLMVGVISALTGRSPIIRPEELLMGGKKEEKEEEEEEEEEEKKEEESSGWELWSLLTHRNPPVPREPAPLARRLVRRAVAAAAVRRVPPRAFSVALLQAALPARKGAPSPPRSF